VNNWNPAYTYPYKQCLSKHVNETESSHVYKHVA
jgi:hypothetical protein